jgi:hypothetical protein
MMSLDFESTTMMRTPLLIVCLVLAAPVAAQRDYVIPRHGVQFHPPKGWTELPAAGHRGQLVAMFCAPRPLTPRSGAARPHTPTLRIRFFPADLEASPDEVDGLPMRTPFRDFDDYIARGRMKGADVRLAVLELGELKGRLFTVTEGRPGADRTLYGALVPMDDGQLVIEFELLADHLDKQRRDFDRCLDSFGPAEVGEAQAAVPVPPWRADPAAWKANDEAARAGARQAFADAVVAAAENPELGWKSYSSRAWTVLSAADAGFTKKAIQAAEAMREWSEQHFASTSDRTPLPAVLRIFASPDHYTVLMEREAAALEYDPDRRELYFYDDPNAGTTTGFGMLLRAVLWQYLDDEEPGVASCLPRWLDQGLWEYCRSTQVRGKKIEFESGDVEKGRIRYQQREDSMPAVWNLIQESIQPTPEDGAAENAWGYTPECARLVRWVLDHEGGEAFGKPDLLAEYVRALGAARADWGPDPTANVDRARLEEEQAKAMWKKYYPWRDGVLRGANDRVVGFEVGVWEQINAKWLEFNEKFR